MCTSRFGWIILVCAPPLSAQIDKPPEFQDKGTFQKSGSASTVDGSSHVAAERAEINQALLARLRALPPFASGVRLMEQGLLAEAKAQYQKGNLRLGVAVVDYQMGNVAASAEAMCALAGERPKDLTLVPFLGETVGSAPEWTDRMTERLQTIAQAHPQSAEAQFYWGVALLKRVPPATEQAMVRLQRSSELDKKSTRALVELARQKTAAGRSSEAIADLEEVLRRDGSVAVAHYRLAMLYRAVGPAEKSREHLERFRQLKKDP